LLSASKELDSDVILLGSTGVGSLRGRFLGSVSSQVVDHAHCSVMVFREGQTSAPAHVASVVVGVDGSKAAGAAIAAGRSLAAALDAKLVLVAAYRPSVALAPSTPQRQAELRQHAVSVLGSGRAAAGGETEVTDEVREGEARHALIDACERHGPSVLVVGTRGLGGFTGLLLGSTSRWVLNHAPCPVLVARDRRIPA
jgi:nucleotide-binding universal stress UspA family protein